MVTDANFRVDRQPHNPRPESIEHRTLMKNEENKYWNTCHVLSYAPATYWNIFSALKRRKFKTFCKYHKEKSRSMVKEPENSDDSDDEEISVKLKKLMLKLKLIFKWGSDAAVMHDIPWRMGRRNQKTRKLWMHGKHDQHTNYRSLSCFSSFFFFLAKEKECR